MTTDEVNVKLTADGSQFEREIVNAGKKAKDFGETVEKSTDKASDGFDKLKSAIAGLGLVAGLKNTLNLAGELEQNLGGAKAVFGNYAKDMQNIAAQAYSKLGLSQSDYLATANKMGALFKGSGFSAAQSADMTTAAMQRAADVASIMGLDIGSAMESIAGAAKGNFTMMDNLGVAINDTTLKLYAQEHGLGKLETTQQKVNAAMQMFLDKTEYAAGNYTKENDTFAGAFQTAKAEVLNLVAAVGTELLPAATTIIPIVTDVIREVSPVVADVANGISWVAQGLKGLDNPMGKTILYVGLATAVLNKMKFALGGTATGLILVGTLLSWVIGRLNDTEQAEAEVVEASMDGAAAAADKAAEGVDGLTNSMEDAEKAANRLAGFDEITKLSGGSGGTLASKIASAEDLANIEKAKDGVSGLQDALGNMENLMPKAPDIKFGDIVDESIETGSLVIKSIFGTDEEKQNALQELNDKVTQLFGPEWTTTWNQIGSDIYTALNNNGQAGQVALGRLKRKAEELFGENWTNFWVGVGDDIAKGFSGIFDAFDKASKGDWAGAAASLLRGGGTDLNPYFDKETKDRFNNAALKIEQGDVVGLNREVRFIKDGFSKNTQEFLQGIVVGSESLVTNEKDELANPLTDFVKGWNNFWMGMGVWGQQTRAKEFDYYMGNQNNEVKKTDLNDPPASASQVADMLNFTGGFAGVPQGPVHINNSIYLDSEQIYNENKSVETNGKY